MKSTERKHFWANSICAHTDKVGLKTVSFVNKLKRHFIKIFDKNILFYTNLFLPYIQKLIQIFLLQSCFVVKFLPVTNFLIKRGNCTSEFNKLFFYIIDTISTIFLQRINSFTMKNVSILQPAPMKLRIWWVYFYLKNETPPHTHTSTQSRS